MEENVTLFIDPVTHDLALDGDGSFRMIAGHETAAQCVRLTLETFRGSWFLDRTHGTDYDAVVGDGEGDPAEVIRAAVYQEPAVRQVDGVRAVRENRLLAVSLSGTLTGGAPFSLEVIL